MDIKKTGAFIAECRKAKHMTQKELAAKLNVTDKAVSKWERGVGYPEITTIPVLAELLGVSTSEIMLCGHTRVSKEQSSVKDMPEPDAVVSNTVEYMEHLQKQNVSNIKDIAFLTLSAALLIGMFICGLCNYIISAKFDWSLYVFGSAALVWLTAVPLLKLGKYRWLISLACFSITIVPFLLLTQYLCPAKNWVIPFALPITIISLAALWIFLLLITFIKMKLASTIAIALIIFGVLDNLTIQHFVGYYLNLSPTEQGPSSAIVAIACGFAAACILIFTKKRKPNI